MGFDKQLLRDFNCIIVNLEQLGENGRTINPAYIDLLKSSWVIDYDVTNKKAYKVDSDERFTVISFGYAPYLSPKSRRYPIKPLEERALDVVFYGSINEKRLSVIKRLEEAKIDIKVINNIFGPERDQILDEAKLILNLPYYEKAAFEQVRAFHALSLGVPFANLQRNNLNAANIPAHFIDALFSIKEDELITFFEKTFKSDQFYLQAERMRMSFKNSYNASIFKNAIDLISNFQGSMQIQASSYSTPKNINLGSGKDYKPGYLNIDISESKLPDIIIDLSKEVDLPVTLKSLTLETVTLKENYFDLIYADNILEHVSNLPRLIENCLRLLKVGGRLEAIVPYERSYGAWQDPTHVRAMNENSWIYYSAWSWYLDWSEYNFSVESISFLNDNNKVLKDKDGATQMHASLVKKPLSLSEKSVFRCMSADFGNIPSDTNSDLETFGF